MRRNALMMFAKNRLGLGRLFSLSNHRRHWVIFHWMALTFSGSSTSSLPAKKTTDLHLSKVKHKNICHKTHRVISSTSSNLILMSCQPHRVTSGQSNSGHKQMHISKLFSHIYQPSVKSVYKTNHFTNIKHTYKTSDTIFSKLVPLILPLLKEHIRLGHAGSIDHSV